MIIRSKKDSTNYARALADRLAVGSVVTFDGPLGVGKTFLIKELCKRLGVTEEITSPSYVLMNCYQGRVPIFHLDLYRLQEVEELYELGLDECFQQGICLIEWSKLAEDLLPAGTIRVKMKFLEDNTRELNEEI